MSVELHITPVVSVGVCAALMLTCAVGGHRWHRAWMVPAALSAVFAVVSLRAVIVEGPWGFWPEHTRNLWGNQIFADLLLAATTAVGLSAESARRNGLRLWAWVLLILGTGSIGLCTYAARLLYLDARAGRAPSSA